MIAREHENLFLVDVCVDLYTIHQWVPRASIDLCSFVAGFTVDEEERRIATERVCDDLSFLLMDADLVFEIDMGDAEVFFLVV